MGREAGIFGSMVIGVHSVSLFHFPMEATKGEISLKDYPRFEVQTFQGLRPYDLKWAMADSVLTTRIPKARWFNFTSYSLNGLKRSKDGKCIYINMQAPVGADEEDKEVAGFFKATAWITQTCANFYLQTKKYIMAKFAEVDPKKDMSTVEVSMLSGEPQMERSTSPFLSELTFYPSAKYCQFFKYDNGHESKVTLDTMLGKSNSYFRLDLSINSFEVRYVEHEHKILIKCFTNVPYITYLNVPIPEILAAGQSETVEDRRAKENEKIVAHLAKKRKGDQVDLGELMLKNQRKVDQVDLSGLMPKDHFSTPLNTDIITNPFRQFSPNKKTKE